MKQPDADSRWTGKTDGMPWMHRSLIAMLRVLPVDIFYAVVDIVIVFYILFARRYRKATCAYFRRFHRKNRVAALWHTYLTYRQFGQVVIDRFAVYAGQHFDVTMHVGEGIHQAMTSGKGCVMLSAHVGNYEMAGYFWRPPAHLYVLAWGGEKSTILENRKRILASQGIDIIYARDDWSHLYAVRDALQGGNMLALFGDRNFGSDKTLTSPVLDQPARLPKGPFVIAAHNEQSSVLTAFVMKRHRKHYEAYISLIDGDTPQQLADHFAQQLTQIVRRYPHQWYNFYDFWQ